jgi:hypothetical protein
MFKKKTAVYLVNLTDTEQVQFQTSYTTINKCTPLIAPKEEMHLAGILMLGSISYPRIIMHNFTHYNDRCQSKYRHKFYSTL